jgi:hypothetical protein
MDFDISKTPSTHAIIKDLYKRAIGYLGALPLKFTPSAPDGSEKTGVCDGTDDAALSDTVNLANPGYFEVTGNAGNIKFDPVRGAAGQTRAFEKGVVSRFKVKKIYAAGAGATTATGIVIYY